MRRVSDYSKADAAFSRQIPCVLRALSIRYCRYSLETTHAYKKAAHPAYDPLLISRFKKLKFLATFSEDDFRDQVVRPLLSRLGFAGGTDTCGTTEEGKDAVFAVRDLLGTTQVYVLQTKKGKLNLSSKASENLESAIAQCRTALATKVRIPGQSVKMLPDRVILCASGTINKAARDHIIDQIQFQERHIRFMDAEDLIPLIDDNIPEFWYGLDADKFPYLKALRSALLTSHDTIPVVTAGGETEPTPPITDALHVSLTVHRYRTRTVRRNNESVTEPYVEEVPLQALLGRSETLVHLVGAPGSGKTTALQRMAFHLVDSALSDASASLIPVFLKAKHLAGSTASLLDAVTETTIAVSSTGKPCFSSTDLDNGGILLLIDALDEAPSETWPSIIDKIVRFHQRYPACRVIVTSRNYRSLLETANINEWPRYTLSPLDLQQAMQLLERLQTGKPIATNTAKEVLRQLQQVHGLELNPLLVTVFVAASDFTRRDIPANITELFKKYTELMFGRWDLKKGLAQQYQSEVKDHLLCRLAFIMHSRGGTAMHVDEAKSLFKKELARTGHPADFDILWAEAVDRSGLLIVDQDQLSFRHMLLQEFFAGRGVPSPQYFKSVLSDERWKHPLIFHVGQHPDSALLLEDLIAQASMLSGPQLYRAAIAIGLAIQTSYLSDVTDRLRDMHWTVESLAKAETSFLEHLAVDLPDLPLMEFLNYYFFARDSVAYEAFHGEAMAKARELAEIAERVADARQIRRVPPSAPQQAIAYSAESARQDDLAHFWYLISIIESGHLAEAESLVDKFHPGDPRLLLAIHLGCFLVSTIRIASVQDQKIARRICRHIMKNPYVQLLIPEVKKEFNSVLLEVHKGQISGLPMQPGEEALEDEREGPPKS